MDWSKIKTIFIISFLILDVYLMYEFLKIRDLNQYEVQTESLEKGLKADGITYGTLPKVSSEGHYLKAKPKVFTNEDLKKEILADQTVNIISGTVLDSLLDEPLQMREKFEPAQLSDFIESHVLYGNQYVFWEKSEDGTMITYYQQSEGKTFYQNVNGELTFFLNEKSEIVSYKQTYLDKVEELSGSEKIIAPIKAIEALYENGSLAPNSKITKAELGYYTLVPLSDTTQVLNPAWRFVINDKENLYVSAFEGKIIELNNEEKTLVE